MSRRLSTYARLYNLIKIFSRFDFFPYLKHTPYSVPHLNAFCMCVYTFRWCYKKCRNKGCVYCVQNH